VTFKTEDPAIMEFIYKRVNELADLGITFDTGGCQGQRDWELDWSFKYTGVPDPLAVEARSAVEHMLRTLPPQTPAA
jgi:hypothetical protein